MPTLMDYPPQKDAEAKPDPPPIDRINRAPGTVQSDRNAIRHFDIHQESKDDPVFNDLKACHVENENLKMLLKGFSKYLAESDLHRYGNEKNGYIGKDAKQRMFGKVKDSLKFKFPEHPDWPTEDVWYHQLYKDINGASTRGQIRSEEVFDAKIIALFPELDENLVRQKYREVLFGRENGTITANDITSLCFLLMKDASNIAPHQAGPLQKRAWIVQCALAAARAGEVKLQRYDEWFWDEWYQNLEATWSEMKNLEQYGLLFGPHKSSYIMDFYHTFACFYALENGL